MCPSILKKFNLRIIKNNRDITLTAIVAKIYNNILLRYLRNEVENIVGENQNVLFFSEKSILIKDCLSAESPNRVREKDIEATLLFADFSKAVDSIHGRKMEQILLLYNLPKER